MNHAKNGKEKGTSALGYLPWSLKTRTEEQSEPTCKTPIRKFVYKILTGLSVLFFFARRKENMEFLIFFYTFVCSLLKSCKEQSEPWQNRAEQHLTAETGQGRCDLGTVHGTTTFSLHFPNPLLPSGNVHISFIAHLLEHPDLCFVFQNNSWM